MKPYFVKKACNTDFFQDFLVCPMDVNMEIFVDNWKRIEETLIKTGYRDGVLIVDNMYTSTDLNIQDNNELKELLKVVFKLKKEVQKVQVIEQKLTPPRKVCCANNDIDLSPLRNGFFIDNYKSRTYNGHINMNIRFGRKGNINIHKGW